jgi:ATP-dependent helicase/nuclease subunit A
VSFRTHKRLVDLFNSLFAELLVRDESSPVKQFQVVLDNDMTAFRQESPSDPVIECLLLDKGIRDENGNYQKTKKNRTENYPAEDMRRWEAYEIAQYIKTTIESGREIPYFDGKKTAYRPITTGDIAILFQSMSNVTLYEDVFKSQGLQFMTIAGRGYYSRQEVWDMLDLLRALHNPADNLSLATVLRSPMFSFSDDTLFALRRITDEHPDKPKPIRLWDALTIGYEQDIEGITADDKPLLQFAIKTLHSLHNIAGRVTISELLRQALAQTGYLAILTGLPDGARRRGNIEKLLQLAETSGKITLGKFSKYLNDLSAREIREGEAIIGDNAAIKLMTVHASKGLEFPVVILADTSWSRGNAGGGAALMNDADYGLSCQVFDPEQNKYVSGFTHNRNTERLKLKEEAERKRLLYVAATRAKDFLVISGRVGRSAPDKPWTTQGEWLKELMRIFVLNEIDFLPDQTYSFAGDVIRVMMPPEPPPQDVLYADAVADVNLWNFDADETDFPPLEPALIQPIHIAQSEQIKHISATQIADIGGYKYATQTQRAFYKQRFRLRTLHDTPSQILNLGEQQQSPISQRLIGEIVHEVIRYWKFDLPPKAFDDMLAGYAWQHGLTQNHSREQVIQRVTKLIGQFQKSGVYDWITSARADKRPIYHELPFILRTEKRVIHGVMDALLQHADGTWAIIDYKTSHVKDKDFHGHAQRYYLQVGAYASAVQQQLGGIIPKTYIHYIRSNETIEISTASWQAELDKLEDFIGELVKSDD